MAKDTTPIEEFRRVTATTMRAVSRKEVNVSFVPDGGSLLGSEARITVPARDLPVEDVSRVRGEADSMALKLRHHDAAIRDVAPGYPRAGHRRLLRLQRPR